MTLACTTRDRSAYETGRLAEGDTRLFRPGALELTSRAITLAHFGAGATVLDLGCGAGDTLRYLQARGIDGIGIDCADNAASPEKHVRIVARAEALPLADGSVHGVLAECSLSLFQDRERALAECARVLVDGGRLMISDVYARNPDAIAPVRSLRGTRAGRMLMRDELEAGLSNAGFTTNVWEDHSPALRECAARFLFEHGTLDGLWGCGGESSQAIQAEMRAARVGYFLLIATRRKRQAPTGGGSDER